MNRWLLAGALLAILVSFTGGVAAGKSMERTTWLEEEREYAQLIQEESTRANQVAEIYGMSLASSQDTVFHLRRKLNEQKEQLASCVPGGGMRLTPVFVGLYDEALQASPTDTSKPADSSTGASAAEVLDIQIENGRRWKQCRDQLNALIEVVK